jgi:hypothetical protein
MKIRAADAKEVGVGNPAEETYCYPNYCNVTFWQRFVNIVNRNIRPSIGIYEASLGFTSGHFPIN